MTSSQANISSCLIFIFVGLEALNGCATVEKQKDPYGWEQRREGNYHLQINQPAAAVLDFSRVTDGQHGMGKASPLYGDCLTGLAKAYKALGDNYITKGWSATVAASKIGPSESEENKELREYFQNKISLRDATQGRQVTQKKEGITNLSPTLSPKANPYPEHEVQCAEILRKSLNYQDFFNRDATISEIYRPELLLTLREKQSRESNTCRIEIWITNRTDWKKIRAQTLKKRGMTPAEADMDHQEAIDETKYAEFEVNYLTRQVRPEDSNADMMVELEMRHRELKDWNR
jgi:hypothetical protein